jgi:membrane associated rhomboid family serine protease
MNIDNNNNINDDDNHQEENQNQFFNNEMVRRNSLYNEEEFIYSSKFTKITLSFLIILLIKIFFAIYFHFFQNTDKFYYQQYSILNYNQYYRCVTRYFISYGICHFLLEIFLTYKMCYFFENMIGTLYTIIFIFISFIFISFINIEIIELFKYINKISNHKDNPDLAYEGGLTPLFFTLYTFYFSFDGNSDKIFFLLIIIVIRANRSEYLLLLILMFFTPNASIFGNISGIITSYILKYCRNCILPRIIWIKEIENRLKLKKFYPFYRYITDENPIMKKILNEYDKNLISQIISVDTFENGQQMTELTLLSTENDV